MRRQLVQKLEKALPAIRRDLVFDDIASMLMDQKIILVQDLNMIRAAPESARCSVLIDVLAGKEDAAFDKFVNILRVDHFWLADEIMESSTVSDIPDSVPGQDVENVEPENRSAIKRPGSSLAPDAKRKNRPENNPKMNQIITVDMIQTIKNNHRITRDWVTVAHALGLSKHINQIRIKALVYGENLDLCIVNLLKEWLGQNPRDANLKNLINAFRNEGFNDVADQLVEKYAT